MKLPEFQVNDKTVFWGGAITMYAYPLIGWAIIVLFAPKVDMVELLFRGDSISTQLIYGLGFGFAAFLVIQAFIFSKWLSDLTYGIAVISKKLNWVQVVFLSLAAGVGEEILFRISIQYFLGIWLTAIIFVALHGYLNLFKERILVYGIFMVIVSAGFGYLYLRHGILASITAHALVDLLIFMVVKLTPITQFEPEESKEDYNSTL